MSENKGSPRSQKPADFSSAEKNRVIHKLAYQAPLRFAEPMLFGRHVRRSSPGEPKLLFNGTATLIQFGNLQLAITCNHVLDLYEKTNDGRLHMQIAEKVIEPKPIDRDEQLDLAVFNVSGLNLEAPRPGFLPLQFYKPRTWPHAPARAGETGCLGGFPQLHREEVSSEEISSGSWSLSAVLINDADSLRLTCTLDRTGWYTTTPEPHHKTIGIKDFTGLSGSPVMILRKQPSGIEMFELVGIVFQFGDYDVIRAIQANRIDDTGHVIRA